MASGPIYRIKDGVRRAKVYSLQNWQVVKVDVFDLNDQFVATLDVPIEALHSPKTEIDLVSSPRARYRYRRIENAVRQGIPLPNIEVYEVAGGVPIVDVNVVE
jgi:hypothetical protein